MVVGDDVAVLGDDVQVSFSDGKTYPAQIVGGDEDYDDGNLDGYTEVMTEDAAAEIGG